MAPLLKDCGLDGCLGSVQHCSECSRTTVHFRWPGGRPVCGWCGVLASWYANHAMRLPPTLRAR
ncbi:MAG: hypothetical protein SH847_13170 [Roseiflexaceae bacterium]|nr:hypothetical protein [Roseiflexaceae bacterium]